MPVKASYLAIAGTGIILLWSGIRGKSWTTILRDVLAGKNPASAPSTTGITGTPMSAFGYGATSTGLGGSPAPTAKTLPGATGNTLNGAQIGALWIAAGGNPAKVRVAVCIAMAESSGRVAVTSPNPDGGTNVGLWQLDTPGGKGAGYSIAQLQNALTNARVAVRGSSNGTDWSAWATAPSCGV